MKKDEIVYKCHVLSGPLCLSKPFLNMTQRFYKAYIAYFEMMKYPELIKNADCIQKTINQYYWMAKDMVEVIGDRNGIKGFLLSTLVLTIVLLAILIIIYFRKRFVQPGKENTAPINASLLGQANA